MKINLEKTIKISPYMYRKSPVLTSFKTSWIRTPQPFRSGVEFRMFLPDQLDQRCVLQDGGACPLLQMAQNCHADRLVLDNPE
jgi:hypothetical protein